MKLIHLLLVPLKLVQKVPNFVQAELPCIMLGQQPVFSHASHLLQNGHERLQALLKGHHPSKRVCQGLQNVVLCREEARANDAGRAHFVVETGSIVIDMQEWLQPIVASELWQTFRCSILHCLYTMLAQLKLFSSWKFHA